MERLKFVIPYPPTPWTPSRRNGNFFYNPRDKEKKRDIIVILSQKTQELVGPIQMDCKFFMPIPASFSDKKKKLLDNSWHVKKCGIDNLKKFLSDVLEAAGIYKNDSQICAGWMEKRYSVFPRTEVELIELIEKAPLSGAHE